MAISVQKRGTRTTVAHIADDSSEDEEEDDEEPAEKECHHDDVSNFINADGGGYLQYFGETYKKKKPNWPKVCGKCMKNLVYKKEKDCNPATDYRVTVKNNVFLCPNGAKNDHTCRTAYCSPCFNMMHCNGDKSHTRDRRPPNLVFPGEVTDLNSGTVRAAI